MTSCDTAKVVSDPRIHRANATLDLTKKGVSIVQPTKVTNSINKPKSKSPESIGARKSLKTSALPASQIISNNADSESKSQKAISDHSLRLKDDFGCVGQEVKSASKSGNAFVKKYVSFPPSTLPPPTPKVISKDRKPISVRGMFLYPEQVTFSVEKDVFTSFNRKSAFEIRRELHAWAPIASRDARLHKFLKTVRRTSFLDSQTKDLLFEILEPPKQLKEQFQRRAEERRRKYSSSIEFEAQGLTNLSADHYVQSFKQILESLGSEMSISKISRWTRIAANLSALFLGSAPSTLSLALVNLITEAAEYSDLTVECIQNINLDGLMVTFERVQRYLRDGIEEQTDDFHAQALHEDLYDISEDAWGILSRVILSVYGFVFDEKVNSLEVLSSAWQKKLNDAYKNTSCIPELLGYFVRVMKSMMEWFTVHILGQDPDYLGTINSLGAVYNIWTKELFVLQKEYNDMYVGVAVNPACRKRVMEHHAQGQELLVMIQKHRSITRDGYGYFIKLFDISIRMNTVALSYNQATKFRIPSYMFQFTGGSGVGKTTSLNRLARVLNNDFGYGYEEGNLIYTRCQSSQYWEGYHSQMMTLFDDLFQNKDQMKRGNLAEDIIFICNSSPVSLDMASVESKGKVVFSSPFIAVTTNVDKERSLNIACPEAFWRRFNSRWELFFDKEFLKNKVPDRNKIRDACPNLSETEAHYALLRCRNLADNSVLSYDEMVKFISKDAREYRKREAAILKANEDFVAKQSEDIVLSHTLPEDGPIPSHISLVHNGSRIEVPLSVHREVDFDAQSILDKPFYGAKIRAYGSTVTVYLSARQLMQITHEYTTNLPVTSYDFVYKSTSEAVQRLKSLSMVTRETICNTFGDMCEAWMMWALCYLIVFYCRVTSMEPPAYCRRRVRKSNYTKIFFVLGVITQVAVAYGVIKVASKSYHWAFGPILETQSNFDHNNPRINGGQRYVSRYDHKAPKRYDINGYNAQGMEDDNYSSNVYSNACKITFNHNGHEHSQRGLFVNAGAILCTVHFIKYMERSLSMSQPDNPPFIRVQANTMKREVPLEHIRWVCASATMGMDIGMLDLSNFIPARKSILSYFVREQDVAEVRLTSAQMLAARVNERDITVIESVTLLNPQYMKESPPYKMNEDVYYAHRSFMYENFSQEGMCGSVMIHNDKSKSGSIIGIHVAGHEHKPIGIAQLVTRESVEDLLTALGIDFKRVEMPEYGPLTDKQKEKFVQYNEIEFLGQVEAKKGVRMPTKTQLEESVVHDEFIKHITIPAMLKPTDGISPIQEALKKANKPQGTFDAKVLHVIFKEMDHMYAGLPTLGYDRTLTYKETANGIRGSGHLKSIDISSSSGYPYVLSRTKKGKKNHFDHIVDKDGETLHYARDFFAEVQRHEEMLANKEVPFYVFTASLKDERRPIEKALAGKTRMFSAGNVMLLTLCRKYFGGFLAFLTANGGEIGSKVGSDLAGKDFDLIYRYCGRGRTSQEMESNWLHGDFSSYDVTLMSALITGFFDAAIKWYARSKDKDPNFERNNTIRKSLTKAFDGPVHILGRVLFSYGKGNTSGNFATVHINGFANEVAHRYIFYKLAENQGINPLSFADHVNLVTFGDDSLGVVSSVVAPWYNGGTLAPMFKSDFGMIYTNANKGDDLALVSKDKVTFCKRSFVYNDDLSTIVGVLPRDVIFEITNWIRSCANPKEATVDNIDFAHSEIFLYGRQEYEDFSDRARMICEKARLTYTPLTYDHRCREFLKK